MCRFAALAVLAAVTSLCPLPAGAVEYHSVRGAWALELDDRF